ncbi:hypothetical protein NLU13_4554 [Sarocladium strictum]|uniref:Endoplasmic reticulum junction formation protein lunapark n=1 Tax=Sarocladium strictum TaxID=5046 RepID=A0AA39L906_SARSR|nr:hypothetical protein NLU13_4554 [Sarocladium strictum]
MVSWLPWRSDSSSTASFEKTLSTLSAKITASQTRLDKLRATSRRVQVLATLYLSFAYLIFAIVAFLVIGANDLGQLEWAGVISGPFLVFGIRKTLAAFYSYRIESISARLSDQQAERAKTIQKLKDATKYDSTMELIEKYGGVEGNNRAKGHGEEDKDKDDRKAKGSRKSHVGPMPERTTMPPPPTANIQRRDPPSPRNPQQHTVHGSNLDPMQPTAEFAPNAGEPSSGQLPPSDQAFAGGFPASGPAYEPGHWYDRIFDVLLGEDETASKNRIVLICQFCRIVNGQAPPGTRSLAELGLWRCMSCGASNGTEKEDEGKRIIREVLENEGDRPVEPVTATGEDILEGEQAEPEIRTIEEKTENGSGASARKRRGKANT